MRLFPRSPQTQVWKPTMMILLAVTTFPVLAAGGPNADKLPPIYDSKADGEAQIREALGRAALDHKRVLLQFGANWCIWCHRLHDCFDTDAPLKKLLANEFELVLIDIDDSSGQRHNEALEKRMGRPTKNGLPVLVVLNDQGKPLTTINTEPLEKGDSYDLDKVASALSKWKAKLPTAKSVLDKALTQARREKKNVFLYFSAPWCQWCRKMAAYLSNGDTGQALHAAFVPVKIDIERMRGGDVMAEKMGRTDKDGLPFFVILDASGKKLGDSRAKGGNVGYPAEPFEIAHFMKVVRSYGTKLSESQYLVLENALK